MKKVLLAVSVFCLSITFNSFGQASISISVTPHIDTCELNSTLIYSLSFTNNDTADFNGFIAAKATVNGFPHSDLITASPLPITAGSTVTFTNMNLPVNTNASFWIGDNVVVIWPVAMTLTDTLVGDTIHKNVKVNSPNGITDPSLNSKLFISSYGGNNFQIHNLTKTSISQSTVFDLNGRKIEQFDGTKNQIKLDNFSAGIYLLDIILTDGRKAIFKIAVQ